MNLQDGQIDKGKGGIKEFKQKVGNVKGAYYIPKNYLEGQSFYFFWVKIVVDEDEIDIKFDHLQAYGKGDEDVMPIKNQKQKLISVNQLAPYI